MKTIQNGEPYIVYDNVKMSIEPYAYQRISSFVIKYRTLVHKGQSIQYD